MKKITVIPNKILKECFEYDAKSPSSLRWKARPFWHFSTVQLCMRFNKKFAGKPVGSKFPSSRPSYWHANFKINGRGYSAVIHRIVYSLYYNVQLTDRVEIDHKDRNGFNNTPSNLRTCNIDEQAHNKGLRKDNKTGYTGVYIRGSKFSACISINGKTINLGSFYTAELAYSAYLKKAKKHKGKFFPEK